MKKIKRGRGVEATHEALIAVLRKRFPGFVDWETFEQHFQRQLDMGHQEHSGTDVSYKT